MQKPAVTPPEAHSGAVAPAFIVKTSNAEPFANLAGVLAEDAYKISPAVVKVISIVLLAGNVQNTSFVPAARVMADVFPSELVMTVVRASVELSLDNVPTPTSHSSAVL